MGLGQRIERTEMSGVLNRVLEAWAGVVARGGLETPTSVNAATIAWVESSNGVARFAKEWLIADEDGKLDKSVMYDAYREFIGSEAGDRRGRPISLRNMITQLKQLGYVYKAVRIGDKMPRMFVGIKLTHDPFNE